jgi:hypothetical protein
MTNKELWIKAKTRWEKIGLPELEPPHLAEMKKKGWDKGDLGKKFGVFDAAKSLDAKRTAWAPAKEQADKYVVLINKALKESKKPKAKTELAKLESSLKDIIDEGEKGTQDPKPSGRAEQVLLVAAQNAAGGIRPKWLEVGAIDVKAYLVVDAEVTALEKSGEIGYHWIELQKACADEVKKSTDAFAKTIMDLDAKLQMLSDKDRAAKVKEANEVLKHYRGIVEANVNRIVDQYWARALQRKAYLKTFKKECKIDIASSTVAIAASSVSIAMSFGAAALSAVVIAKAVLDIALTLEKLNRDADTVKAGLETNMATLEQLYKQRLAAKGPGGAGQKGSKAVQVGKAAVASAMGPISEKLLTTTSRTLKQAMEFTAKLTGAEEEAGKLYKKLNEFTKDFPSAPKGPDASKDAQMQKAHAHFMTMNQQYQDYAANLRDEIAWGEACVTLCQNLAKEDYSATFTTSTGTATKLIIALASLAKLTVQLVAKLA